MSTYRRDRKPDSELVLEFRPAGAMAAQRFDVSEQGAEAQAWSEAYRQLRSALLATIWRPVSDPQVAEDLLHDVFAKAVRAMREGRAARNLAGWLHQVVRTTVADHYRARRLDVQLLVHEPPAQEEPDSRAFQSLATCLQPLSATLPPLYRDALHRARGMLRERVLACCAVAPALQDAWRIFTPAFPTTVDAGRPRSRMHAAWRERALCTFRLRYL